MLSVNWPAYSMFYHFVPLVRMKVLAILWLLMTTLVGDSMQCTLEQFEVEVPGLVRDKFAADRRINVTITKIYYNCLSTTVGIGNYSSMSVSLIFNISSDPNTEREIRYNMVCNNNGGWNRYNITPTALRSNETRTDCYQCINTTINMDHCSREYIAMHCSYVWGLSWLAMFRTYS